jgi:hypothetical protein
MPTVAEIAKEAFDAVAQEMPDVIQAATLTRTTQGAYDPVTGSHTTTTQAWACRALFADERALKGLADAFPSYVVGPSDRLTYIEGLATHPIEGDAITIGGKNYLAQIIADIVGVGTFFSVIVRNA